MQITNTDTNVVQERTGQLYHQFNLPTVAEETTSRFTKTGHGDALPTLLVLLEQEAEDRRKRRIIRLRRESSLPLGKTHALGYGLVESGHSVLFAPACRLVQELLAARQDPDRPRRLCKLDKFEFLLLDDLRYLPRGALHPLSPHTTNGGPWE